MDSVFEDAITELIATNRQAPLFQEISKAVEMARARKENFGVRGSASFVNVIVDAAQRNTNASKEFVAACVSLAREKCSGKVTLNQFLEGCALLESAAEK